MAQAVGNQQNDGENAGTRSLATFQRENPPTFKGKYDPDGALAWLKEMERIFRVMDCTPAQKVRYGTHMLAEESDDWWLEARPVSMAPYIGAYFAVDMFIGTVILFVWEQLNRKDAEDYAGAVASGLICGDGIWTIPSAILSILRIDPPICMSFGPSASS